MTAHPFRGLVRSLRGPVAGYQSHELRPGWLLGLLIMVALDAFGISLIYGNPPYQGTAGVVRK